MKRLIGTGTLLTIMGVFFVAGLLWAGDTSFEKARMSLSGQYLAKKAKPPKVEHDKPLSNEELRSMPTSDVRIGKIAAGSCYCESSLRRVDAICLRGIKVELSNVPCESGGSAPEVSGRVEITYFDLERHRMVNHLKSFALSGGEQQWITMVDGYVLLKKSTGIEAQIITTEGVMDCNRRNNELEINECREELL
jgi:hypothetical protein